MEATGTHGSGRRLRSLALVLALTAVLLVPASASAFEVESLNGYGNNLAHPTWGEAGSEYQRLAPARYADGMGEMITGPNPRYISNRIMQLARRGPLLRAQRERTGCWVWGQFLDHTFGRAEIGPEQAPISFNAADPLESFSDTLGYIPFNRAPSPPGPGTGPGTRASRVNTEGSYIDAAAVYGNSQSRLEWLRSGPDNGKPGKPGAEAAAPARLPAARVRPPRRRTAPRRWSRKGPSNMNRRTLSSPATCAPTRTPS